MTGLEIKVPKELPAEYAELEDEATEVLSFDDGPPTEIIVLATDVLKEEAVEDDILLDLEEDGLKEIDTAGTDPVEVKPIAPPDDEPVRPEPQRPTWAERLRASALAQLGLLSAAGLVTALLLFDGPTEDGTIERDTAPSGSFPTIEIEGAPPVTEEDIERRLRTPRPEAVKPSHEEIRKELKAIAAVGREAAGVEPLPERRAPQSRRGGDLERSREVEASVAREVGGTRRVRSAVRRFYVPGGTMKIEGAAVEEKRNMLPLPVGARLHAKLEVGISSGHPTAVLARLAREIRTEGRRIAPKDSMVKGRFQADGDKIYATFSELILPSGESLEFEGYAVDRKVPGLVATRREIDRGDPGGSIVQESVDVAKGVVRSVASGSIVGQVAQGLADGALPEQKAPRASSVILEVAAGKRFQIVVTKGGRR